MALSQLYKRESFAKIYEVFGCTNKKRIIFLENFSLKIFLKVFQNGELFFEIKRIKYPKNDTMMNHKLCVFRLYKALFKALAL